MYFDSVRLVAFQPVIDGEDEMYGFSFEARSKVRAITDRKPGTRFGGRALRKCRKFAAAQKKGGPDGPPSLLSVV
jgi:hypothetical protein